MGLKSKLLAPASLLIAGLTVKMLNVNFVVPQTQEPILDKKHAEILDQLYTYESPLGPVSYRKIGSGRPLVLIHDAACYASGKDWLALAALLSEENYEVFIPDLPGCGVSPSPETDCTCLLYMTFLENFLSDVIKCKADLISLGLSAVIVLPLTQMHPELINAVTMINPAFQASISLREGFVKESARAILSISSLGRKVYKTHCSDNMIEGEIIDSYYYNAFKSPARYILEAKETARNQALGRLPLYKSLLLGQMDFNVVHILKAPKTSLRVIIGEAEPHAQELAADIAAQNPDIPITILPSTKHMPQLEDPEALLSVLLPKKDLV